MSYDPNSPPLKDYLAIDRKALIKEQGTTPFDGKKACFIPDEKDGFVVADIVSSKGDEITVQVLGGGVSYDNSFYFKLLLILYWSIGLSCWFFSSIITSYLLLITRLSRSLLFFVIYGIFC